LKANEDSITMIYIKMCPLEWDTVTANALKKAKACPYKVQGANNKHTFEAQSAPYFGPKCFVYVPG